MKKVLVFQHVPYEILGTLDPLLRAAGYRIRYINFGREPDAEPDVEKYQGLVVLGGPMNADMVEKYPHLRTEVKLIKRAMELGIPILGICLGAQLIAKTLGARVFKNSEKEIGWYDISLTDAGKDDPLMRHLVDTRSIFEWHSDTFDLPDGAVHLASGLSCSNQAFRYGENVYGFQFHMEVDEPLVERWLNTPIYQSEIAQTAGKIDPEVIREQTSEKISGLNQLSVEVFGEFLNLLGRQKRFTRLGSM